MNTLNTSSTRKTETLLDYVKTCLFSVDNLETTPKCNRVGFSGAQFVPKWAGFIVSENK